MGGHAAALALAAGARADHEIGATLGDRRDEKRDQLRAVAAVAIEKHQDVAIGGGLGAGPAGPAVAALALADDRGAGGAGARDGAVAAAAVDDDDLDRPHRAGSAATTPPIASSSLRVGMTQRDARP